MSAVDCKFLNSLFLFLSRIDGATCETSRANPAMRQGRPGVQIRIDVLQNRCGQRPTETHGEEPTQTNREGPLRFCWEIYIATDREEPMRSFRIPRTKANRERSMRSVRRCQSRSLEMIPRDWLTASLDPWRGSSETHGQPTVSVGRTRPRFWSKSNSNPRREFIQNL
jgi:hypothetical protein